MASRQLKSSVWEYFDRAKKKRFGASYALAFWDTTEARQDAEPSRELPQDGVFLTG